jgi:hypothetical protein
MTPDRDGDENIGLELKNNCILFPPLSIVSWNKTGVVLS